MIWLVWRQHRLQLLFAVAGLAVIAAFMLPTGLDMHRVYQDLGLADCFGITWADRCQFLSRTFSERFLTTGYVGVITVVLPLLAGIFWGVPLVAREIEHRTHRMVWTQGVSRHRWATVKISLLVLAVIALAVGFSLLFTWWADPLLRSVGARFDFFFFDLQGPALVGYTLFAVALGMFAGALVKRTLPAMALTLTGYLAVRFAVEVLVRPNILPPLHRRWPLTSPLDNAFQAPSDWILSRGIYNAAGQLVWKGSNGSCDKPDEGCLYGADAYNQVIYQPGSRFWLFQWIETGIFAVLAAALLVAAVHWIRRRIA
jgi:hypothetical protein